MKKKNLLFLMFALAISSFVMGQSASATYTAADIPTTYGTAHSSTCSGAAHPLTVTMPAGSYTITSVDVVYDMTSVGAWMSEQRSRLACSTTGTNEGSDYAGVGSSGTYSYNRSGLTFANGTYTGDLIFENWAFRRYYNPTGCSPATVKVDNGTWTVTVNYTTAPTCPDPTAQTESSIEANSAVLGWTENGSATSWDIELGANGFSPTGTPTQSGVTNPYTYESLTRNTSYDWYVRAGCGGGDYSSWTGPSTFTTTVCDQFLNGDFETGDFTNWTVTGPHNSSVVSYGGSWSGYIDVLTGYASGSPYDPSNTNWETISQVISICDEAKSLCFDMAVSGSSWNDCGQVWVKDAVNTYTRLFKSARTDPWASRAVDIEAWAGDEVTIYFAGYNGNGYSDHQADIYFDNVFLSEQGVGPSDLTVTNITLSGADLSWTSVQSFFDIYIVTSGSPVPDAATTPTVNDNSGTSYTWSGGNPGTEYDWYVRKDYAAGGGSGQSLWSGPSTFLTAIAAPWSDDLESHSTTTNATWGLGWTTSPSGTTTSFRWNIDGSGSTPSSGTGPSGAHSGSKYAYCEASNGSTGAIAQLYTPNINLSGLTNTELSFWYHMYGATMGTLHVDVYEGTTWTNDVFSISGQQQTSATAAWIQQVVDLSSFSGTIQIRFRGQRGSSYTGDMSIDDVTVSGDFTTATWDGNAKSNDWHTAGNWDTGVPGTPTDVTIPAGLSNYPTLSAAGSCNNITIKSDATGDGSLLGNSNLTVSGAATVERYLTEMKWHFIGIPVNSATAGVFHLPGGHSDIYLKTHNENDNTWGNWIVPVTTPLIQGRGYEVWVGNATFSQPETIDFIGALNAGNYTTGSGNFYELQYTSGHGLNLICNPYPSALQANINTWTKTNIVNSVWTWDGTAGNYVYWNGTDTTGAGSGVGSLDGGIIPSMQAFFVLANGASPSLTIPESSRVHSSQAYYKSSSGMPNTIRMDIEGNGYSDAIFISFKENATDAYDSDIDVKKLFGLDEAPQLYSIIPGENLSINSMSGLDEYKIVDLGFECSIPGIFTIEASEIESFNENITIFLEDLKAGIMFNLSENPSYSFINEVGDNPNRFLLHFGEPSSTDEVNNQQAVRIYSNENVVYITVPANTKGNIFIYNMMGQEVASAPVNSMLNKITLEKSAYYVVKVLNDESIVTRKVFIK